VREFPIAVKLGSGVHPEWGRRPACLCGRLALGDHCFREPNGTLSRASRSLKQAGRLPHYLT
jgi:hypothetical protein